MKHVTSSANDSVTLEDSTIKNENDTPILATTTTPNSTSKVDKRNFQKRCYGVFVQMAENSSIMVKNFEKTDALLERVDQQMDRLIEGSAIL